MAENKEYLDRVRYNMTDNQGNPVNVPGWLLKDWIAAQEAKKEPDPKVIEQMLEDFERDLEDL